MVPDGLTAQTQQCQALSTAPMAILFNPHNSPARSAAHLGDIHMGDGIQAHGGTAVWTLDSNYSHAMTCTIILTPYV